VKIILLDHQNNYVEYANWLPECQNFLQHRSLCLNDAAIHNYFDISTKLFSDLYLTKFLDTSTKIILFVLKKSR